MATMTSPAGAIAPPAPSFAAGIADPGPLGLAAFAMTTFFLSSVNTGWLPASVEGVVLGLALFYGGIVQVLAGMWEFAKGNTFGAVAFSSYGAFWLSFWYLIAHTDLTAAAEAGVAGKGVGFFLLGWTIFTLYMLVCTLRTNGVLVTVFGLLFVTFLFLTLGKLLPSTGMTTVGGYFGLLTALGAWYGSMAGVMNSTVKRVVLPVFPRA
jgi:succinate-acetate transporter protein